MIMPSSLTAVKQQAGSLLRRQKLDRIAVLLFTLVFSGRFLKGDEADTRFDFFERQIRPILVEHCYECHSASSEALEGNLQLDYRDGLLRGGDSGSAVVIGAPETSLLISALKYETLKMPPSGKLPDHVIRDFELWVSQGAHDPRVSPPSPTDAASETWKAKLEERSRWWSLQPVVDPPIPNVSNTNWSDAPVDRFVLSKAEELGLTPSMEADPQVLHRRLSFVLTGLPPTVEEVLEFEQQWKIDPERAYRDLVEELLASPRFGERFARHWMDVIHYTDTYGYEWDIAAKGSWEFRDYLIRAFNNDVGFDQLLREQLAGDLLTTPRVDHQTKTNESLIGPMFFHFGERRHGSSLDFAGIHQEMIDSQIDVFSKSFLGLTVACARCHDHKLDAVSQNDYYALAGMFMTPRWTTRSIDTPDKYDLQISQLSQIRQEIRKQLGAIWSQHLTQSAMDLDALATQSPIPTSFESPAYPLTLLSKDTNWQTLKDQWDAERTKRREYNRKFITLNYQELSSKELQIAIEGTGLSQGYVHEATPLVSLAGDEIVSSILPEGIHTNAISPKLPGAIRLPEPERFPHKFISLRLKGGEWGGYRAVPQNAFLNEGPQFFDPTAQPAWLTFSTVPLRNGVTRVLTEISTPDLNANFPPRTGVAKMGSVTLPNEDSGFNKKGWFSLTGLVMHDEPGIPLDDLEYLSPLFDSQIPSSPTETRHRLLQWYRGVVDRFAKDQSLKGDAIVLQWLLEQNILPNDLRTYPSLTELVTQYRAIEKTIDFSRTVNSFDERELVPINYRLNIRGDVYREGQSIPHGFIEVFSNASLHMPPNASGRSQLAEYLVSSQNPLVGRVYVNRVWHWLFGTGLVDTPNDFGKLGGRPSHPELLDWLTLRFREEGWSTKRLVRQLVLSQTFRQAGTVSPLSADRDPSNRYLTHYPTRRLEAEAIRDSILAVAQRMDNSLYGIPIRPFRSAQDSQKRLFSGPLDGNGRRSIYLEMSVMQPPEFLVGFNLPDLKTSMGRRDVTNVPAQALILMNNPFVKEMASHMGRQLADSSLTTNERITHMFLAAYGRKPTSPEMERWTQSAHELCTGDIEPLSTSEAWGTLILAIFNSKEFLYYR